MSSASLFAITSCENGTKIPLFSTYASWFPSVYLTCVVISLTIAILGLIGNVLNILVLSRFKNSIPYLLMIVIAAFDNVRLVGNIVDFIFHLLEALVDNLSQNGVETIAYLHGLILVAKHTGSNASIYVLAFLSVLQVRSVKHPLKRVATRVVYCITGLLCLSQFLLCAPYAVLTTAFYCPSHGRFKFHFTRQEITLYRVYVESIVHTLLPTILVALVSYSLIVEIRKANAFRAEVGSCGRGPLSVSRAVFKLNVIFLTCNIPHAVYIALYIYRLIHGAGFPIEIKNMIVVFADGAACFNSGVNFLIYYTTDNRFKYAFLSMIGMRTPEQTSQPRSLSNRNGNGDNMQQKSTDKTSNTGDTIEECYEEETIT